LIFTLLLHANDTADELSDSGEPVSKKEVSRKTKINLCLSHPTDTSQTTLCEISNRSSKKCDIPDPVDKIGKDISLPQPFQGNSTDGSYDRHLLALESVSEDSFIRLSQSGCVFCSIVYRTILILSFSSCNSCFITFSLVTTEPLLLNNFKETFLLEKAMESINSTEDAVNYILQQSDTPAYDLYSTSSENSQFTEFTG
jgi:hypothetical protein